MPKKSFKDNPALQFISAAEEIEREEQKPIQPKAIEKPPTGYKYKINPYYIETKTRRLQLVLQPSLYERVKTKAKESGLSVNEYVHRILDNATREE